MPNALQITDPNADNSLAQAQATDPRQFFADTESELSPLELWLAQQRAKNNAQGYEPLPGITSGAPRYGQNTSQLGWQAAQQPVGPSSSSGWSRAIGETRPADFDVDRRAMLPGLGSSVSPVFKIWRGGNVLMPSQDTRRDLGELPTRPMFLTPRTQISQ